MAPPFQTWNDARKSFLLAQVPGSDEYWTLNDLEYAYAMGPTPEPQDEVSSSEID